MNRPRLSAAKVPQIKVCGLTDVEQAMGCSRLGAQAIGCVFYPKSPRYLSDRRAADICRALPPAVGRVGVFVDEDFSGVMRKVERCGLTAVQLHGRETPELVARLRREKLLVIKALFIHRPPHVEQAADYAAGAFLVEYGRGTLPGGTARAWDWGRLGAFSGHAPLILAGGLSSANVGQAIRAVRPDAVDVSSNVESAPGQKDLVKVKAFVAAVAATRHELESDPGKTPRRVF